MLLFREPAHQHITLRYQASPAKTDRQNTTSGAPCTGSVTQSSISGVHHLALLMFFPFFAEVAPTYYQTANEAPLAAPLRPSAKCSRRGHPHRRGTRRRVALELQIETRREQDVRHAGIT